jgi:hypothetical protein
VLGILAFLVALVSALSWQLSKKKARLAPAGSAGAASAAAATAAVSVPDSHAKVVTAAALYAALKDGTNELPLQVILAAAAQAVSDSEVLRLAPPDLAWSLEGRRAIFASHSLPKFKR